MKKIILVLVLCIFVIGCQKPPIRTCTAPEIKLNERCCLDTNNNYYCDDSEPKEPPIVEPAEPPLPTEIVAKKDSSEIINLEAGIYDAYYPLYRYEFSDEFGFNVSGFESSYKLRKAGRFRILNLKVVDDFPLFIKQKYENTIDKKNEFAPKRIIEKQYDPKWSNATFKYIHNLDEDNGSFIEKQLLIFEKGVNAVDLEFEYSVYVKCQEDAIVQIDPLAEWEFDYSPRYASATVKKEVDSFIQNQKKKLLEDAGKVKRICAGEKVESGIEPGTIELNLDGFIPEITTIQAGDSLSIHNNFNSNVVLIFTREQPRKQFVSQIINKGAIGTIAIDEPGNYSYFINGFNPKGFVEVEVQ